METTKLDNDVTREKVRERYADAAKRRSGCDCGCAPTGADSLDVESAKLGYSKEELDAIPEDADLGLGCGNPTALAGIHQGETVLDLGSGGGIDCFIAARAVGPQGRVIGVDMTDEMLDLAKANARRGGFTNVEFRKGIIEELPVESESVDLVISNCVINLSTDKPAVFKEIHRVLRPGGRISISDIVVSEELPAEIRESITAYVGCIAGALTRDKYLASIREVGFEEPIIDSDESYGALLAGDEDTARQVASQLGVDVELIKRWAPAVRSLKVRAYRKA